jgi:tol-pal system protein YbgF
VAVLSRRLDALTTSVTALTTRVDDLAARLDAQARQAIRSAPPPAAAPRTPPASVPLPATPAPAGPPPAAGTPSASVPRTGAASLGAQDVYQAAYIDYSKGSYALAVAGFREFIRRHPEHELADNAQYWIGESLYSLGRTYANQGQSERCVQSLEQAVQEFKKVVANYPRGDKAPTALYKEALVLIELKQPAVAQLRLQYLIDNFPQAEETPLARERLASLKDR